MIDLQTLVEETGAESGLSFNIDGILNESVNLEYDGNVAAMIGMILKMCLEMSEDVNTGELKQVMIKNLEMGEATLDMSSLTKGMYLIQVTGENYTKTEKIILN